MKSNATMVLFAACIAGFAATGVYAGSDSLFPETGSTGGQAGGAPRLDFAKVKVGDIVEFSVPRFGGELYEERKALIKQILHEHFIDLSARHTVIYGVVLDRLDRPWTGRTFMQVQNGPVYEYDDGTNEAVTACLNPKTGLANIVDRIHNGGTAYGDFGYVTFIGVNPQTRAMETVYSEYAEHGPYNRKICVWPAKQEKLSILSEAMKRLRIEDADYKIKTGEGDDEKIVYESIGGLRSGETMQLPWRRIPAAVAQAWLEKLRDLAGDLVINEKIHSALVEITDEYINDWRLVQATGTELCSEYAQGVVLAKHASWQDWRAIYNVQRGCSKTLNYPLRWKGEDGNIKIENGILQTEIPYQLDSWGAYREVALDLRTNVITAK